jgi:hypothetical protein
MRRLKFTSTAAEYPGSTTVVLPGFRASVDQNFNILITPND